MRTPTIARCPYTATLTVTGKTDSGDVEASDSVTVRVTEKEGYVIGGWSVGGTGKDAVRALLAVGAGLVILAVWLAIFSPVWIVALRSRPVLLAAQGFVGRRRRAAGGTTARGLAQGGNGERTHVGGQALHRNGLRGP